jgi:hypothetical protein
MERLVPAFVFVLVVSAAAMLGTAADAAAPTIVASRSTPLGLRCVNRVEAGIRRPRAGDRVVGRRVAFVHLARGVQDGAAHPLPPPNPWAPFQPVQSQLLVRDGSTVSIIVPTKERSYLRLLYNPPGTKLGSGRRVRVRATACRHSSRPSEAKRLCGWSPFKACLGRWTEFEGGLLVDYRRAGRRLRCAYLIVRIQGRPGVRVRLIRARPC